MHQNEMLMNRNIPSKTLLALAFLACLVTFSACKKDYDLTATQKTMLENQAFMGFVADKGWQIEIVKDDKYYLELEYSVYLDKYLIVKLNEGEANQKVLSLSVNSVGTLPSGTILKARVHVVDLQSCTLKGGCTTTVKGVFDDMALSLVGGAACVGGVFSESCTVSLDEGTTMVAFDCFGDFSLTAENDSHCTGNIVPKNSDCTFNVSLNHGATLVNGANCTIDKASVKALDNSQLNISYTTVNEEMELTLDDSEATVRCEFAAKVEGTLTKNAVLYYYGAPDFSELSCDESSVLIGL